MGSTTRTLKTQPAGEEQSPPLRWRNWPLVEHPRWSWLVVIGILSIGGLVWWLGGGWLLGVATVAGLAATLWQFFVPIEYEIGSLGLRRYALRRIWLLPWHSVRAYQSRAGGLVIFQRSDPTHVDALRSIFVPYPADEDELHCALRRHLSHAAELPQ